MYFECQVYFSIANNFLNPPPLQGKPATGAKYGFKISSEKISMVKIDRFV